jgi:hypothetical protein
VYLEVGKARVFAAAADWPGWCRSGRTEELALDALAEYAARYSPVPERAGISWRKSRVRTSEFAVVARLPGDGTTDFGAPGQIADGDRARTGRAAAARQAALVRAAWDVFDEIAAVTPQQLRKGPRGGGRDRDKMVQHLLDAEASYARRIGVRLAPPRIGDAAAIEALRAAIVAVLGAPSDGQPPSGWPPRYAARRIAWHVLDHAWEMQDRTE